MKENPQYAKLNPKELEDLRAEFGRPMTKELALWFIRNRANRDAVERMLDARSGREISIVVDHKSRETAEARRRKRIPPHKKCA